MGNVGGDNLPVVVVDGRSSEYDNGCTPDFEDGETPDGVAIVETTHPNVTGDIWIRSAKMSPRETARLSLGILQAARLRVTRTEYISCPSCGRTLFDLQAAVRDIKAATSHLKGLKIGVMGCIVNGRRGLRICRRGGGKGEPLQGEGVCGEEHPRAGGDREAHRAYQVARRLAGTVI